MNINFREAVFVAEIFFKITGKGPIKRHAPDFFPCAGHIFYNIAPNVELRIFTGRNRFGGQFRVAVF